MRSVWTDAELRSYLLDTMPSPEKARLEQQLAADAELAARLEAERTALAMLDGLPGLVPPAGLAEATLRRIRESEHPRAPSVPFSRMPIYAATSVAVLLVVGIFILPALSRARESARRASVSNSYKQLGLVFKMYANENKGGAYPPMAPGTPYWVPDFRALYPKFMTDFGIMDTFIGHEKEALAKALQVSPPDWETINRIAGESFVYFPWTLESPEDLEALTDKPIQLAQKTSGDLEIADKMLYRTREGIERYLITDINNPAGSAKAQANIPVLFQRPGEKGAYVLFMDGHVEFLKLDSPWLRALQHFLDAQKNNPTIPAHK